MELIQKNNQAVRIISTGGNMFRSLHLVNARSGIERADVVQAKSHSTLAGARKWAAKQLAAA